MKLSFRPATEAEIAFSSYGGMTYCAGWTKRGWRCKNRSPWHWNEIMFGTFRCHLHTEK